MKRFTRLLCLVVGAAFAIALCAQLAHARVVGAVYVDEVFPDIVHKAPSCKDAYDDYLAVAKPLKACHDLEDAQKDAAIQDAVAKALTDVKCTTKDCKKKLSDALEAGGGFKEQVNTYKADCPDPQKQYSLVEQLPDKRKDVCKRCDNKWPGQIGPYLAHPCK